VTVVGIKSACANDSSEAQISIDTTGFPVLVVEADNARIVDILKQLGEQLGFRIEHLPQDNPQTITATLRGELNQLLQGDRLGRMSYVLLHRDAGIDRLIVVNLPTIAETGTKNAAAASNANPTATQASLSQAAPPATSPGPADTNRPRGPSGRLNRLLRAQAIRGSSGQGENAPAASAPPMAAPDSTSQSALSAMARAAQVNAQSLVSALRAACIGSSCASQ